MCQKDKVGLPVPGEGSPDADIVFLGEAPGKQEAKTGRPFVGQSGKLLRKLIVDIGLNEEDVFITSPVKYLPKHVTPTRTEIAHGRIHLFQQLDVIQPKVVVLLGRVACEAIFERTIDCLKQRGQLIEGDHRHYFLTYHPAAALYARALLPKIKQDFEKIQTLIRTR